MLFKKTFVPYDDSKYAEMALHKVVSLAELIEGSGRIHWIAIGNSSYNSSNAVDPEIIIERR